MIWEWIWLSSIIAYPLFGMTACKKSNVSNMTKFIYTVFILGLLPVLFAICYYAGDAYKYATAAKSKKAGVEMWRVR